MYHSFRTEVAEKYGVEKAILLENFYFWIKKNEANKTNIHEGRAYTYNTAEAYEKLFPYMKARRIAQLLREMENKDDLLISGQFGKYDRTKSYTLSDNALSILGDSNIQNLDNETYQNSTIKNQESVDCLNTDTYTDIKQSDNKSALTEKQTEFKQFVQNVYDAIYRHNETQVENRNKIPIPDGLFNFEQMYSRSLYTLVSKSDINKIKIAFTNYLEAAKLPDRWQDSFGLKYFFTNYVDFTRDYFDIKKYKKNVKENIKKLNDDVTSLL